MSNNILEGIKVVELGTHVAIPYCTRTLADWGADVIKIEPPRGESYRNIGRLFRLPFEEENNVMYTPYNVNKKNICLNLKNEESVEILYKLLEDADVFATNTRPKALENMGLNLDTIKEKFPRLIVVHLNGFGEDGPEKDRPGFDAAAFWCRAGAIGEWTNAEDRPFKPFYGYGDSVTSYQLLAGVLSALYNRERTGKGDVVKISLFATGLWTNATGIIRSQPQFGMEFPRSRFDPLLPLDNFYKSKDGRWFLVSEEHWEQKCNDYFDFLGKPEMKGDESYCTLMGSIINVEEMVHMYDEEFAKKDSSELAEFFVKIDSVFEFVAKPEEVYKDEQAWANGFLQEVETPGGMKFVIPTNPIRFNSQDAPDCRPAPMLGQHSVEILKKHGYSDEQINALIEKKSILAK